MFNLVDEIEDMGKKYISNFETNNKSDEIKILDGAFKNLKSELDNHIKDLYYKNNEFQTIFDNMPGILYIRDVNCNILMINSKGMKAIGEKELDFEEKKCYELFFNRREICYNCPIEKNMTIKNEYHSELRNNGKIFDISCFPIFNIDGTTREIIVYSVDKTNEIMKNLELSNAEKFALIGQVSAGVTHELKNNISVIKGVYYLLNDIAMENDFNIEEIREIIFEFKESIKNAESTVNSLLKFSNRNGDVFTKVNVIPIIDQILIFEKNNFYRNKIKVTKNYYENTLDVYASDNYLKFIFTNIVKNALEAMKCDGGNLIINAYKKQEYIYIEIVDTGKGMEDNIKLNIFEPFSTTKEKGSGLGLWIAKNQAKKLNGNIYCESKKNVGTKFIIVLPLNKES
jgi:polar amino acid transport system substrate-binding protein